jgi:hypothetical protein
LQGDSKSGSRRIVKENSFIFGGSKPPPYKIYEIRDQRWGNENP